MDDKIRTWLEARFVAVNRQLLEPLADEERVPLEKLRDAILIVHDDISPHPPEA